MGVRLTGAGSHEELRGRSTPTLCTSSSDVPALGDNVSLATLRAALGELTSTGTGTEMAPPGCNAFTP